MAKQTFFFLIDQEHVFGENGDSSEVVFVFLLSNPSFLTFFHCFSFNVRRSVVDESYLACHAFAEGKEKGVEELLDEE